MATRDTADTNYSFTYEDGTLTVTPATLDYGEQNPELTVAYTGFKNDENEAILTQPAIAATTATASSPAGQYPINVNGAVAENYSFSYAPATLTIEKASLMVTVNDAAKRTGKKTRS